MDRTGAAAACLVLAAAFLHDHRPRHAQHDHTSSLDLHRNYVCGALHDNLCRIAFVGDDSCSLLQDAAIGGILPHPVDPRVRHFAGISAVRIADQNLLRLRRARNCAVTVDGATWVRAPSVLSPHQTGGLHLLDGRRQQAGAPLSRRRRRLPRAAACACFCYSIPRMTPPTLLLMPLAARVRYALRAATGAAGAARRGHFRVRHFGGSSLSLGSAAVCASVVCDSGIGVRVGCRHGRARPFALV